MNDDLAKTALQARADLAEKLATVASSLNALAELMAAAAGELGQAVEAEEAATQAYVCFLESRLSEQRSLS